MAAEAFAGAQANRYRPTWDSSYKDGTSELGNLATPHIASISYAAQAAHMYDWVRFNILNLIWVIVDSCNTALKQSQQNSRQYRVTWPNWSILWQALLLARSQGIGRRKINGCRNSKSDMCTPLNIFSIGQLHLDNSSSAQSLPIALSFSFSSPLSASLSPLL
jgi:hypothetical protein